MKITKRNLRRIIKEEKVKLLSEQQDPNVVKAKASNKLATDGALEFALDEYGKARTNQDFMTARDLENEVTTILEKWLSDVTLNNGQVDTSRWGGPVGESIRDNYEGMSPEQMPDTWRQVLGNCLKGKG
jgi:hypothetical protein